jgi:hypothetical protein
MKQKIKIISELVIFIIIVCIPLFFLGVQAGCFFYWAFAGAAKLIDYLINIIKRNESLTVPLHGADFEENTLTLQLPKNFWDYHSIKKGDVTLVSNCINKITATR